MSSNPRVASSSKRLDGKVAIITGGASGIGAAAARLFHSNGAKVVVADIQDNLGQAIANELGKNACYIHCDVSQEDQIIDLIDTTIAKYGQLDIMYNNAGITEGSKIAILETSKSELDRVIGVNLVGSFLGAKHAARVMIPRRRGCVLFTASASVNIAGLGPHAYAVTKHAIAGLAKNLSAELGQHGIRVNCVSPYAVMTGIAGGNYSEEYIGQMQMFVNAVANLKGKTLTADDVAQAALYLASDEAGYVSGLNLVVDGGFSVVNPSMMTAAAQAKLHQK
ncbi:tropinone reductase-like 1 [Coffea eugenioides]|uniref:Tropinone reductase-like 1 n=1 Tax=Coffea arabica TaxID=13443 RepID=A0A6P6VE24_COFAR|nr:tropinone reductase-like 1 [Coffea arabica]XP_027099645.1 tropinone reductase-like 1 [Coffea arabica]XP_027100941.1 tropinone reductase-like 1 [Coffea arabica]XP_027151969.1 tropinone reductase-like 1 [Coffea eugenioides]XP_027155889.1 tropinone reductase-like 1 [Coffea eugenioides]